MPFRPVVNPAAGRPDELFICLHIATLPAINQSPGLCPGLASSLGRPCPSVSGGGGTCRFHRISRAFRSKLPVAEPPLSARPHDGTIARLDHHRRSEARRVGKELVSTCRVRWS